MFLVSSRVLQLDEHASITVNGNTVSAQSRAGSGLLVLALGYGLRHDLIYADRPLLG